MNITTMKYGDFIELRKQEKIYMCISMSDALSLIKYLPKYDQIIILIWFLVLALSVPGFLVIPILVKWWVGLLLLFFVTPAIFKAIKQTAAQFVLQHAENEENFFTALVEDDIITFRYDRKKA